MTSFHKLATPQRMAAAAQRRFTHAAAPPLHRGSMVPTPWRGFWAGLRPLPRHADVPAPQRPRGWALAAGKRRNALVALVLVATCAATGLLLQTQPVAMPFGAARLAQLLLFALLFAWIAAGCITACMGWRVLRNGDARGLSYRRVAQRPIAASARTAVVMPICNEHVPTVFAGLLATAESLVAAGGARLAEIYVLSDTSDPLLRSSERQAWTALRDRFAATGLRVHYRWRLRRTRRKAGNVADFCRRWGRQHTYMVVLDADSVMSGEAILGLVRLMEAQPQAGIIQSAPIACGLETPHARAQQFAGRVTGRLFSAGMQYWQLGESHYWGHNAIIRIAPFMAHCALAPIAGRGGLAGDILSHDFVEAALMRRAGWQVWLVSDLPGSWEQQPPHLLAELQRDRRWCQGNLQNAQLITEPGMHAVHRAMFATGAMAYLSAPLWFGFVLLGVAAWLGGGHTLTGAGLITPITMPLLWAATVGLLAVPRVLGVALVLRERRQHLFGGTMALVSSALLEGLWSALQAPVRMAAHTLFVVGALTGLKLQWRSPPREATRLRWREAAVSMLPLSAIAALALACAMAATTTDSGVGWWLAPMAVPLLLAWPLAVWGGRPAIGAWMRRCGLLLTPEETAPSHELRRAGMAGAVPAMPTAPAVAASPAAQAASRAATQPGGMVSLR